jgi:hypothetical protein
MLVVAVLTASGVVGIVGCATQQGKRAPTVDVTGTWTGYWTMGGATTHMIQLILQQSGNTATGVQTVPGAAFLSGAVEGTVSGNELEYLNPFGRRVYLTVSGDEMTGISTGGVQWFLRRER